MIEGPLAGGHLGFHEEQLETYGIDAGAEDYVKCRTSYEKEIIAIMQVIHTFSEKYGKKIPVAMGGGIHDSESAARAFSLGADAIQVATRFVTTEECDADIQALINAAKGKIDDALLFCGAYAYQATHLETVKEVIDSLIPERV